MFTNNLSSLMEMACQYIKLLKRKRILITQKHINLQHKLIICNPPPKKPLMNLAYTHINAVFIVSIKILIHIQNCHYLLFSF